MQREEQSVAPKERVNIVYKPQAHGAQEESELPLKILMIGDYAGRPDGTALDERKPIRVGQENFGDVMAKQDLALDVCVPDRLSGREDAWLDLRLRFGSLRDFEPEGLVEQVPELRKLLELRAALTAVKGPLGNIPAFRKRLQALLGDPEARRRLEAELQVPGERTETP